MSIELQKKWNGAYPEDTRRLEHLRHERRYTLELTVASANATKDGVEDRNARRRTRDEASRLCHERNHPDLSNICALSAHVRTRCRRDQRQNGIDFEGRTY